MVRARRTHRAAPATILGMLLVAASVAAAADPPLPAFPGAEGFGAVAQGGRGGRVIKVTNLNADGPGSLQAACLEKGPRIVVFDVSGVIPTKHDYLEIGDGQITIAGQTAPGAGITIQGELSTRHYYDPILKNIKADKSIEGMRGTEMIIRFLRMRPKELATKHSVRLVCVERFILDHVSGSWGTDEDMDFSVSRQFTVQWCGIEPSGWDGPIEKYRIDDSSQFKAGGNTPHCYGMIMGYTDKGNVSLHHNLFTHHNRRTPLCGLEVLDERNNVIYNVAAGIMFHSGIKRNKDRPGHDFAANVVANYFKCGPSVPLEFKDCLPEAKASAYRCYMVAEAPAELYAEGNYLAELGKTVDVWAGSVRGIQVNKCQKVDKPWPAPPVTTQTAEEAYKLVLAQVGCLPRDAVSKKAVEDTRNGTGMWGRYEPEGGLMAGLTPGQPPADGDSDGMPDEWEKAHGLNSADPSDANKIVPAGASKDDRHKGYTYIEFYVNGRADQLIAAAIKQALTPPGGQPDGK